MGLFQRWFGGGAPAALGDPLRVQAVEAALDDVRPLLAADGGNVDVVEVTESGVIRLRWRGACRSCGMRDSTAGAGLEPHLRSKLDWFRALEIA